MKWFYDHDQKGSAKHNSHVIKPSKICLQM